MQIQNQIIIEPKKGFSILEIFEVLKYKDLIYFMVLRDIKVYYKQTILGFGWAILQPFVMMVVFTVIFGKLAKLPSDGIPYPIFAYVALVPWTYFSNSVSISSGSLMGNSNILTKVYFPRIIIPMVPIISKSVDFLISFIFLILMMFWYKITPGFNLIYLPIPIFITTLFALGLGLLFSSLAVQYRDVNHALGFLNRLMMYGAPIVWPLSLLPDQYRLWVGLYPMTGVIEAFRACLLNSSEMPWDLLSIGLLSSIIVFLIGYFIFTNQEKHYADVV